MLRMEMDFMLVCSLQAISKYACCGMFVSYFTAMISAYSPLRFHLRVVVISI